MCLLVATRNVILTLNSYSDFTSGNQVLILMWPPLIDHLHYVITSVNECQTLPQTFQLAYLWNMTTKFNVSCHSQYLFLTFTSAGSVLHAIWLAPLSNTNTKSATTSLTVNSPTTDDPPHVFSKPLLSSIITCIHQLVGAVPMQRILLIRPNT